MLLLVGTKRTVKMPGMCDRAGNDFMTVRISDLRGYGH